MSEDQINAVPARNEKPSPETDNGVKYKMHTKDILAGELNKIGLGDMAIRAAHGHYHDYLSPLATPCIQLAADLTEAGTPEALALRDRHINGEFDASKDECDVWFKEAGRDHIMSDILDNKAGGRMTPEADKAHWQPKASRALKPDAQPFDRIEIVTVPRYKQSEMSGDEWRIHVDIIFYRKGREVHRVGMSKIEYAAGVVYAKMLEAMDNGIAFYAGEDDICDQEGCAEKATWRHELKAKYDNSANKSEPSEGGEYRLFCDRHKTRGDCGYEDGDDNYIVAPFSPPPLPA